MSVMTAAYFALFDTAIGVCGIAWTEHGVCGVQLPEPNAETARARLRRRVVGACEHPPIEMIQRTIDGIAALLAGRYRPANGERVCAIVCGAGTAGLG